MSLLGTASFDVYGTANVTDQFVSVTGPGSIVAGAGRCGTAAWRGTSADGSGPLAGVAATTLSGYASFAYNPEGFSTTPNFNIGQSTSANNLAFLRILSNGAIEGWKGVNTVLGGIVCTTAVDLVHTGHYTAIGVEWLISVTGYLRIFVNGVLAADSGTIDMTTTFSSGQWDYLSWTPVGFIDDLYWGDTAGASPWNAYFGDCHVEGQVVNGAGTYQEWTPSAGIDHVALVDEIPPDNGATYVSSSTPGQREIFGFPAIVPIAGAVFGIQLMPDMSKTNFDTRQVEGFSRSGGVDSTLPAYTVSNTNFRYYPQVMQVNPATSAAWTISTANAMEGGVEIAS